MFNMFFFQRGGNIVYNMKRKIKDNKNQKEIYVKRAFNHEQPQ